MGPQLRHVHHVSHVVDVLVVTCVARRATPRELETTESGDSRSVTGGRAKRLDALRTGARMSGQMTPPGSSL